MIGVRLVGSEMCIRDRLSATIDNAQKMGDVGQYVSITNVASILFAVVVPRSPKRDDDDGDSDKG